MRLVMLQTLKQRSTTNNAHPEFTMQKTEEQLKAEAAAKEAAEAARLKKEQDDKEKKEQEQAKKTQEAVAASAAAHKLASDAATAGANTFGSLTEVSSVDDVTAAGKSLDENVKVVKDQIKKIKAEQRKFKDHAGIQDNLSDAEKALTYLEGLQKSTKDRIKVARDAAKKAEAEEKELKRKQAAAEKEAEAERKKAEKEAKKEPEQNGVRKPSVGTLCRAAWDLFDAVSVTLGQPAPISFVLQVGVDRGLNEANLKAEYARWKKYSGIEGRVAIPVPQAVVDAANAVVIPAL